MSRSTKSAFEFRPVTVNDLAILHSAALSGIDIARIEGGNQMLCWGPTKHGHGPFALIDYTETEYVIEPHVTWLPWATLRLKKQGFEWALRQWNKVVFLLVHEQHTAFYDMCVKRGLLRKIGELETNGAPGGDIHMYQKRIDNE